MEGLSNISSAQKDQLMDQVKQQVAIATAQELLGKMTEKCYRKCITKPGTSLDGSEQKCVAMCMDRYMDTYNLVSRTYSNRLMQERNRMCHSIIMAEMPITLAKECQKFNCPLYFAILEGDLENLEKSIHEGHIPCIKMNGKSTMKRHYEKCLKLTSTQQKYWKIIIKLLELDPSIVDTRLEYGETLLMKNVQDVNRLKHLLRIGADPNICIEPAESDIEMSGDEFRTQVTAYGGNALTYATRRNASTEIIRLLISLKVDVNIRGWSNSTCLMYAIRNTNLEVVRLLIQSGSDVNAVNSKNQSALMIATMFHRNGQIVATLLENGADPHLCDLDGSTALHYAAKVPSLPTIRLLVQAQSDILKEDKNFSTPILSIIMLSCNTKNYDCLRYVCQEVMRETDKEQLKAVKIHPQEIMYASYSLKDELLYLESDIYEVVFNSHVKDVERTISLEMKLDTKMLETKIYPFNFLGAYIKKIVRMLFTYPHNMMIQNERVWTADDVKNSLTKLIDYGFEVAPSNPEILSPFTILMASDTSDMSFKKSSFKRASTLLVSVAKFLIEKGANVNQRLIKFKNENLRIWSDQLMLPDALWVAAMAGNWQCVRLLLPFWTSPPLSLLIFLVPLSANATLIDDGIYNLFDILTTGGPVPMGTQLYEQVFIALERLCNGYEVSYELMRHFIAMHAGIPSLLSMCRFSIRNRFSSGPDLPQILNNLVPPGLRPYMNLHLVETEEEEKDKSTSDSVD